MALTFTLEEMSATLEAAKVYTEHYSSAIEDLDSQIKALANDWVSTEVGTYEEFVSKYNEKKQSLFDARDHMILFCNKLNEKMLEFQESANTIKSSFE